MPEEIKKSITIFKTPSWGILGTAFLIMLGAKCFGYAPDLSWLIVTCPLWGPFAIGISILAAFYAFVLLGMLAIGAMAIVFSGFEATMHFCKKLLTKKEKENTDDGLYS